MKKGEIYQIKIEDYKFPNRGLGYLEDKTIEVKNTLPEQIVSARIIKKRRGKVKAEFVKTEEKAPYERDQLCHHFGICGGCLLQTMPYHMQLKHKSNIVKDILDYIIHKEYIFEEIIPSPKSIEYRNKMEFSFGDEYINGPLSLGMHRRGRFHDVVTTYDCILVDNDFREILKVTLEYCLENSYPYFHRKKHTGLLRHFVVRKSENTGEILVNIVTSSQGKIDYEGFKEAILGLDLKGEVKGIIHTINDDKGDVVKGENYNLIYGVEEINEIMSGLNFKISPFSFFQTNTLAAEKLYEVICEYAGDIEDKIIYDLYSGTGTIAQVIAKKAKKVYAIEIVKEAVEKAKETAELNDLKNCEFIAGDVLDKIDELKHSHIKPDIIILDPPRQGLHPEVIQKILRIKPERFVYISCKPTSMRNDLPVFLENGYKVVKTRCVDMFPQTAHVEAVILLTRKNDL